MRMAFFFHFLKIKFRCTVSFLSTWVVMTMTVKFRFANIRRGKWVSFSIGLSINSSLIFLVFFSSFYGHETLPFLEEKWNHLILVLQYCQYITTSQTESDMKKLELAKIEPGTNRVYLLVLLGINHNEFFVYFGDCNFEWARKVNNFLEMDVISYFEKTIFFLYLSLL